MIFCLKSTKNSLAMIKYDNQTCTSSACVISQINVQKLILFFSENLTILWVPFVNFSLYIKNSTFQNLIHLTIFILHKFYFLMIYNICVFFGLILFTRILRKKKLFFFNTEDFYIVSPCQSIKKEKNGTHNFLFASPL